MSEEEKSEMIFQYMLIESKNVSEKDGPHQPIKCYESAVLGVEKFLDNEKKRIAKYKLQMDEDENAY